MMIMYYVREKLLEAVKTAYKDDYEKYNKFFVEMSFRQCEKAYSTYNYPKKKITVNTLSRSSGDIYISYLQELSKHIDVIQRNETHNDKIYYGILRKLLDAALNLHIITIQDLQRCKDDKLKKTLQEQFGTFTRWSANEDYQGGNVYVRVYDSIMIRNILKNNGYYFDFDQICWQKKIEVGSDEEDLFLQEYKDQADFQILSDNKFIITPVYKLTISTYSIKHSDFLSSLNYRYEPSKKVWWKIIFAKDYQQEIRNIKDVPRQKTTLGRNERG